MITACIIADVINVGRNFIAAINMEGWLFIFEVTHNNQSMNSSQSLYCSGSERKPQRETINSDESLRTPSEHPIRLESLYEQRMPANCKELLSADLDGDGQNELIIGLTDRVLRTYKWIDLGRDRGKFVGLYKWEFADQIGSVSLNPSRRENCLDIIVAQPGGTYARLECFDKKPLFSSSSPSNASSSSPISEPSQRSDTGTQVSHETKDNAGESNDVRTEYISKLTPEYHQLALAQMRNHHISTEILGGLKNGPTPESFTSLVIATLDGTLMLVNKDQILWSLQVDHQLFALALIEKNKERSGCHTEPGSLPQSDSTCTIVPTSDSCDHASAPSSISPTSKYSGRLKDHEIEDDKQYLVVCAWNGKTYIIDEDRNYLRFKFEEAVSAFTAGSYYFNGTHHSALVYATFNNQIILYYDVVSRDIKPTFLLDEIIRSPQASELRKKLLLLATKLDYNCPKDESLFQDSNAEALYHLVHDVLYGLGDDELLQRC